MSLMVTALLSAAVVLGYLLAIRWLDRYEREPLWAVLAIFVLGALVSVLVATIGYRLVDYFAAYTGVEVSHEVGAQVVAPVLEEFAKGAVILLAMGTALLDLPVDFLKQFDNETDGLVYGAAAGLGFALIENTGRYWSAQWLLWTPPGFVEQLAIGRTFLSTLVHSTATALIGMGIGYARYTNDWRTWVAAVGEGYGLAIVVHALFNTLVGGPDFTLSSVILVVSASALLFVLTQHCLQKEHATIRRILADEARRGTLPEAHAEILPYWRRRFGHRWLDEEVPKDEYIRLATRLAFRRRQLEISGNQAHRAHREIDELRSEIRALLSTDSSAG